MLGTLQDVILDIAHPVHLVARCHPPVEAAPAEVVLAWARSGTEGMEGQQEPYKDPSRWLLKQHRHLTPCQLHHKDPPGLVAACSVPEPFPAHPSILSQDLEQCHERLR